MSNILAGIGRGQLRVLEERVAARRRNFDYYATALGDLPGVTFQPEAPWGRHTRWLTCLTIDPALFGADASRAPGPGTRQHRGPASLETNAFAAGLRRV